MALLSQMPSSLLRRSRSAVFTAVIVICSCSGGIVLADESAGPWECSGYNGDAHTRCLQAFIEVQRETISKLEGELKSQQGSVNQLREQADRQSAATADLQRELSETSRAAAASSSGPILLLSSGRGGFVPRQSMVLRLLLFLPAVFWSARVFRSTLFRTAIFRRTTFPSLPWPLLRAVCSSRGTPLD